MKVVIVFNGREFVIPDASKADSIKKFKEKVAEITEVPAEKQNLIFCGKILEDSKNVNLGDYRVENGVKIMLMEKVAVNNNNSNCSDEECESPPAMDEREPDDEIPGTSQDEGQV